MTRRNLKRMVTIILTLCMLMAIMAVGVTNANALISSDGEWVYYIYDYPNPYEPDRYQIAAYLGNKTSVTLPEEIDGVKMNTVNIVDGDNGTAIDIHIPKNYNDIYMANNKTLRSVTFDRDFTEPIVKLYPCTFSRCSNLEKVVLPNLIANTTYMPVAKKEGIRLPADTFFNCKSLKELVLPTNIESIGSSCFKNCKSLRSLEIPDGVAEINSYAITGCTNLEFISLPGSLKELAPIDASNSCTFVCPAGSYAEQYMKEEEASYAPFGIDVSYSYINSEPTSIVGDVNGDNELNINDVTLIQKSLVKIYPFDIINYDIYEDNRLSINDATEIQKILANIV